MAWDELAGDVLQTVLEDLGEDVAYMPANGDPVTVRGIFEDSHQAVDPNTGVPFYSTEPMLTVAAGDLPVGSPRPGDQVTRKGTTYRVVGDQPDSDGGTILELKT